MDSLTTAKLPPNPKNATMASYGDDSGVHVVFDDDFVKNDFKSETEGRVVYDHYYMIELEWPGDNTKTFRHRFPIDRQKNEWTERFPRQWEAFKSSKEQAPEGTPIEMWPPIDKKRVFELKANKIFTVEQIAAIQDTNLQAALGLDGRKIRDAAIAFLNPNASVVQVSKLSRENEDLKHQMEVMQQQLASIMEIKGITELPKRRGRKPKSELQPVEAA